MKIRGYITHKAAENNSDCADYFRICKSSRRIAVSDGISQSIMPSEWAKILVDSYMDGEWQPGNNIEPLQKKWYDETCAYLKSQKDAGKNPWMLENCLTYKEGAGATFCGIEFENERYWNASILGDSCLIKINAKKKIADLYSSKEGLIDNRPDFFDSFGDAKGEICYKNGHLDDAEVILIVSDPFSELFQKKKGTDEEQELIDSIMRLKDHDDFIRLVDGWRNDYGMHNDDSTLVIIQDDGSSSFNIEYEKTLDALLEEEKIFVQDEDNGGKQELLAEENYDSTSKLSQKEQNGFGQSDTISRAEFNKLKKYIRNKKECYYKLLVQIEKLLFNKNNG